MEAVQPFVGKLTLSFRVPDRTATARWYQDTFGFTLLYDAPEMKWCELTTPVPGVTIGLSDEAAADSGGAVPTFEVHGLDGLRAQLETRGVRFDGDTVVIDGAVKYATLLDPDGRRLMLAEDLQGNAK